MSDDRSQSRLVGSYSPLQTTTDDDEALPVDFTRPRWKLIDHQPQHDRRVRGVDPYNTVDPPPTMQAWLRIERR